VLPRFCGFPAMPRIIEYWKRAIKIRKNISQPDRDSEWSDFWVGPQLLLAYVPMSDPALEMQGV